MTIAIENERPARIAPARSRHGVLALAIASFAASGAPFAAQLNDTGQTGCFNAAGVSEPCNSAGQDGRYGRDAANAIGALTRTGAGMAGFDFTKIANNGSALPASAALGPNPGDWACTRDNVTGLTWEIKSDFPLDLRYEWNGYTWYSTAPNNGGVAGSTGWDSCNGTLDTYGNLCNSTNYALAVNAATLCGHNDWRLPTINELLSIKSLGAGDPAVDPDYFPNTASSFYWSASTNALVPGDAWMENFSGSWDGNTNTTSSDKGSGLLIRLVRGGTP